MSARIRRAAVPFRFDVRDCVGANGKLIARSYGTELEGVLTRTSPKWVVDRNGLLVPRNHSALPFAWLGGERVSLLEAAGTNYALQSGAADDAAWTKTRTTVSANAEVGPDGTTTADRLIEDNTAAASHFIQSAATITITAAENLAVGRFVKRGVGARDWIAIGAIDNTISNRGLVFFNLATGAIGSTDIAGTGSVVSSGIDALGNGWYWCWAIVNLGGALTTARHFTGIGEANGDLTFTGDNASYVILGGAQFERLGTAVAPPSSYIPTTSGSVTRNADSLYFPFTLSPREMTIFVRGYERVPSSTAIATTGIVAITDAAITDAKLYIRRSPPSPAGYKLQHDPATSTETSGVGAAAVYGDLVELRGVLGANGACTIGASLNGAAEATNGPSTAQALAASWSAQRLYLNSIGATNVGAFAFTQVLVALGTKSMAEMRALAGVS
jgi:hypothetical protein